MPCARAIADSTRSGPDASASRATILATIYRAASSARRATTAQARLAIAAKMGSSQHWIPRRARCARPAALARAGYAHRARPGKPRRLIARHARCAQWVRLVRTAPARLAVRARSPLTITPSVCHAPPRISVRERCARFVGLARSQTQRKHHAFLVWLPSLDRVVPASSVATERLPTHTESPVSHAPRGRPGSMVYAQCARLEKRQPQI